MAKIAHVVAIAVAVAEANVSAVITLLKPRVMNLRLTK
jgi:hypothetical protein